MGISPALGLGSELRPYQRCEFERRAAAKRTTQANWAQLDGMDEFVTLWALTGRAYVKELIRSNGDAQARANAAENLAEGRAGGFCCFCCWQ